MYWATQARSWGMSRSEDDTAYKGAEFFVPLLARVVADGGSLMLNLGPTSDGRIPAMQSLVVREIGDWLRVNGPAIFNSSTRRAGPRSEIVQKRDTFTTKRHGFTSVSNTPAGANGGTASITYVGKTLTENACEKACEARDDCLVYTWYDGTMGAYATMCYLQNSTGYMLLRQSGASTGIRDFVEVRYTATTGVLNAIVSPYPQTETLTLPSVTLPAGSGRVTLLGVEAPPNGTLPFWPSGSRDDPSVTIAIPAVAPGIGLPCRYAFTFALTGAV